MLARLLLLFSTLLLSPSLGAPLDAHSRALCAARAMATSARAHEAAMAAAVKGRYAESLWGFRRACELEPGNALWWNDLGVTLLRLQRLGAAEAAVRTALALDPALASARDNLREVAEHQQRAGGGAAAAALALSAAGEQLLPREALARQALALDEAEQRLAQGASEAACSAGLAAQPVRLAPPLNASAFEAFVRATGIRHAVARLPRLAPADLALPANADFVAGRRPYLLRRAVAPRHLARAGDLAALAASALLANETADFYPESMVEHTVHPFLLPFGRALQELVAPSGDYPLPLSPRGGRYLHLNMGNALWRAYLAALAPAAVPAHLDTADAWLAAGLGEPLATDFAIGNHWRMLLVGSEGAGMFSHQDILKTASYQLQLAGVKTWHICAPSESARLSVDMDMFAPDYARFPGALGASCYLDAARPGDVVFYPADYWHQTLNTPAAPGGLSLALTDTLVDASNYQRVVAGLRDKCAAPTPFNRGGMTRDVCDRLPALVGVWEGMFGAAGAGGGLGGSLGG
jgi:hypothetical protein